MNRLEVLQHKALKVLFNLDPLYPSSDLLKKFKLLSIHDLYQERVAKFVYMQTSDKLPNIFSNYFNSKKDCSNYPKTRNRKNLIQPMVRTENRKKRMKYRGAKIWNTLCELAKIGTSKSYYCNSSQIKKYLISKY